MASLWLTGAPFGMPVATLKAVREALRVFDPDAGIGAAEAILETLKEDGCAHLADDVAHRLANVRQDLAAAGCSTALDINPEDFAPSDREPASDTEGVKPSEPAYRTGLLLMANLEGNPLKAASVAIGLARTTGALSFYTEVVASLILTFPWLEEMLKQQKLLG